MWIPQLVEDNAPHKFGSPMWIPHLVEDNAPNKFGTPPMWIPQLVEGDAPSSGVQCGFLNLLRTMPHTSSGLLQCGFPNSLRTMPRTSSGIRHGFLNKRVHHIIGPRCTSISVRQLVVSLRSADASAPRAATKDRPPPLLFPAKVCPASV